MSFDGNEMAAGISNIRRIGGISQKTKLGEELEKHPITAAIKMNGKKVEATLSFYRPPHRGINIALKDEYFDSWPAAIIADSWQTGSGVILRLERMARSSRLDNSRAMSRVSAGEFRRRVQFGPAQHGLEMDGEIHSREVEAILVTRDGVLGLEIKLPDFVRFTTAGGPIKLEPIEAKTDAEPQDAGAPSDDDPRAAAVEALRRAIAVLVGQFPEITVVIASEDMSIRVDENTRVSAVVTTTL